jgi:sulfide:quinone oxidoreductase
VYLRNWVQCRRIAKHYAIGKNETFESQKRLPSEPNVVVLGCGMGGFTVSSLISKQVGGSAVVTVVEPNERIAFAPAFQWLVFGWRQAEKIQRAPTNLSKKRNVRMVNDKVEKIDLKGRTIRTSSQTIRYDKLVIALGAEFAFDQVPGLEAYSHNAYSIEGALKLRDAIDSFDGGTIAIGISRLPIKCPPAPYELALLLEEHFRRTKKGVEIFFFTPEPHPIPAAGTVIGKQVERLLNSRGIKYLPKTKLVKVDQDRIVFENGSELKHDLLVTTPPHRSSQIVRDAGLTDESGWIPVNPNNLATRHEDVFAIGDITSIETPHGHAPYLPKAGVFAQGQAEVLANNLAVSITKKGEMKQWGGEGSCYLQVAKSESAFLKGTFLSNPPRLEFHPPRRKWFLEKVRLEKEWLKLR